MAERRSSRSDQCCDFDGASGHLRERLDEVRMGIQGVDPVEAQPGAFGLLARRNVDVIEYLEVIRQELHRRDEDRTLA